MYKNKSFCIDCGEEISFISKRCQKHANEISIIKRMKNRRNYNGKNNPNYKGIKYYCKCGRRLKNIYAKKCRMCYIKWLKQNSKYFKFPSRKGNKNNNWQGGIAYFPYAPNWRYIKIHIREKYNYICQLCNNSGNSTHHIDYDKMNCKEENLICLCKKCHAKTNANRDYWYVYFRYIKDFGKSMEE